MRGMTWNVFNKVTGQVMTWDGMAIDFKSEVEVNEFLSHLGFTEREDIETRQSIIFYDGGYISFDALKNIEDYLNQKVEDNTND